MRPQTSHEGLLRLKTHVYRIGDIISMIEELMGHRFKINVDLKLIRPTDERIIVGDVTKLKRDTGWKQEVPMKQTVFEMPKYWERKIQKG